MRRPIPRLIALSTACLLVAGIWLLVPGRQSTAQAFNRLANTIVAAKTARFRMEISVEGQPKQSFEAYYLAPGKFRQELGAVVNIGDFPAGKIVTLIPSEKKAMVMNLQGEAQEKDYFERLRQLLSQDRNADGDHYQQLGEQEIDGRRAIGFRWDTPVANSILWGDPQTGQPVRIESKWNGLPPTETVMSHFEINVELKPSLFDLTPPEGYKIQSLNVDASKPREKDLVQAFRSFSELAGNQFPDALKVADLMQQVPKLFVNKFAAEKAKELSDADAQQIMETSLAIGRGFQFVLSLPESADAHYAGKGVKLNTRDRAVFWYKPAGAKYYRVIDADLSVKDADSAPEVAGAVRVENPGKAIPWPSTNH